MRNKNINGRQSDKYEKNRSWKKKIIHSLLKGLLVFIFSAVFLLMLGAFVANKNTDPLKLELPLSIIGLFISLFAGGVAASKDFPFGALLGGLCFSAISCALVCLLGIILSENGSIPSSGLYLALSAVIPIIGALAAGFMKSKRSSQITKRRIKKH